MDRADLKTFQEWQAEGKAVIKGETAAWYFATPDRSERVAAFFAEQTTPITVPDVSKFTDVVAADDLKIKPRKNRLKIFYDTGTGCISVWCGPNKYAIKMFKRAGYRYDGTMHRWCEYRDNVRAIVDQMSDPAKHKQKDEDGKPVRFSVDLSIDGRRCDPQTCAPYTDDELGI